MSYERAAKAMRKAEKSAERGKFAAADKWRELAEEWRLLANDRRGHDVGFLRRDAK